MAGSGTDLGDGAPPAPRYPHRRLGHAVVPMTMIRVNLAVNSIGWLVRLTE